MEKDWRRQTGRTLRKQGTSKPQTTRIKQREEPRWRGKKYLKEAVRTCSAKLALRGTIGKKNGELGIH